MADKKVPELRFKGFVDDWSPHELREFLEFQNGFNASGEVYGSGTALISVMDILNNNFITYNVIKGKANVTAENRKRYAVEYGDVLFQRSSENYEDAGRSNVYLDTENSAIFGGFVIRGKKIAEYDPVFMKYALDTGAIRGQITSKAQGAQHINVSQDTLEEVLINLPLSIEQEKIGRLLYTIDRLIVSNQCKCEKLLALKKAMLEKMFPKAGSDVPEIRFVGFTGAWEQRKLGDVAEIVGGGTPSTSSSEYWDGDIDWYAPAEIEGQRYVTGSVRKITELGLQKSSAKVLPADKTVLFTSRAGIGKMAILKHPGATNQGFQSMIMKDGFNPYFIYSMGEEIKTKAESVASGSTFLEISGKMLGNIEVPIPDKAEQDVIAEYFEHLDDLIALHQSKYEKLQQFKQSLLEKMFV